MRTHFITVSIYSSHQTKSSLDASFLLKIFNFLLPYRLYSFHRIRYQIYYPPSRHHNDHYDEASEHAPSGFFSLIRIAAIYDHLHDAPDKDNECHTEHKLYHRIDDIGYYRADSIAEALRINYCGSNNG